MGKSKNRLPIVQKQSVRKALGEPEPHHRTARDLANAMHPTVIPNDAAFLASFTTAKADGALARYYLRALEIAFTNLPEPEWVPSEEADINLEHVLPQNPDANWPLVDPEDAKANYKRLGNLALLQQTKNSLIGNSPFSTKKPILTNSGYELTKWIASKQDWSVEEIDERQQILAKLAVSVWPLSIR